MEYEAGNKNGSVLEMIMENLQGNAGRNSSIELYCRGKLSPLIESDEKSGTDYMKTLKTYLETRNSLAKTGEILFIHRNTVFQRIQKISALLRVDFNDFRMINDYYNMLVILKY